MRKREWGRSKWEGRGVNKLQTENWAVRGKKEKGLIGQWPEEPPRGSNRKKRPTKLFLAGKRQCEQKLKK